MNNLYRIELMPMLSSLDAYLKHLFVDTGFYESEKLTIKDFKDQILKDYRDVYLAKSEDTK